MKFYGEVHREGNQWVVRAEPHIMMQLKRVMPRINKNELGEVRITDTPETCENLRWFTSRYAFLGMKDLADGAAEYTRQVGIVEQMLGGHSPPPEFELDLPAREYQRVAAGAALALGGLLVADEVGLGKTATSICMLTDRRTLPALVVTLAHLPRQWEAEIGKFASKLRVHRIRKGTPYNLTQWRGKKVPFPDVLVINYHKLNGWAEILAPFIRCVIFDEIQELRHQGTNKYIAAEFIAKAASYRIGLSATPIYNYGGEFFAVMETLRPGALGDFNEFQREWCVTSYNDKPRIKDPKAFGTYLRDAGLMLRRTRHDVGRELLPLTKIPYEIDSDAAELEKVGGAAEELARIILTQGEAHKGQRWQAAEDLSNILRQATGIAKAPFVAEFVRLLVESGEQVVLYGWHLAVYDIWKHLLSDLHPAFYTGRESPVQKEEAKRQFISGEAKVLIISLRAGAGLDGLQAACRTVVIGELDWSPGVHEQCVGRVYRDGQPDPVMAYFLIADSGSDPTVVDVLGLKTQQIEGIRDPNAALVEELDVGEGKIKKLAEAYLKQRAKN